ncbi:MAG: hypothetical protein ACRENB_15335 [Gemmatimonadales bacterium]
MKFTVLLAYSLAWLLTIRLVCARATVSAATVLRYLALGLLLGPVAVLPSLKLFDPYATLTASPWIALANITVAMAVLTIPILLLLFRRGTHQVVSVADVFLLAFAIGFGFDLVGWLARAGAGTDPLVSSGFLPPAVRRFQSGPDSWVVASTGYRIGAVALVIAAWARFAKPRIAGYILGALTLLVLAAESLAIQSGGQVAPQLQGIAGALIKGTFHGTATPWLVLLLLVILQWREAIWVVPSVAAIRFPGEWRELARALFDRRPEVYRRLRVSFSRRRQAEIARKELTRRPGHPSLTRLATHLEELSKAEAAEVGQPVGRVPSVSARALPAWILGVALPVVLWGLALSLIHSHARALGTLSLAISAGLAWLFVSGPDRAPAGPDGDGMLRFRGESGILVACLAAALIATFGAAPAELAPGVPVNQQLGAALVLVVLASAAAALTISARHAWQRAPAAVRRNALLARALTAVSAAVLVWVTLRFYTKGLASLHTKYGDLFYYMSQAPEQRPPGTMIPWWASLASFGRRPPNGNVVPAWIMAWATLLLAFVAALGLRTVTRAVQRSYRVEEPRG